MVSANFFRVSIFNFISSFLIAIVISYIFISLKFNLGIYIACLFGLYFLSVYSLNNVVEAREIPNNYLRFISVLIICALFDIILVFALPLIFGPNVFPAAENVTLNLSGSVFNVPLGREFYFAVIAVVMLIFNFIIYRRQKHLSD